MTVENLCIALKEYLDRGGNPRAAVLVEGCDCIGDALGISPWRGLETIIIRRVQNDGADLPKIRELNVVLTGEVKA